MNVLYVGKYPPIEGGTSSAAFWRIEALKKCGIHFHVITSCFEDSEYLTPYVENMDVTVLKNKMPWHIPYSQLYAERLISESVSYLQKNDVDCIEGAYLFPFGFAAYVASVISKKPFILRHAGSDVCRLGKENELYVILKEMTKSAKRIVTYKDYSDFWVHKLGVENQKLFFTERYIPNPNIFKPILDKYDIAVFLGKITEKWNSRQLTFFHNVLKKEEFEGEIQIYSSSKCAENMRNFFKFNGWNTNLYPFVHPLKVRDILSKAKYVMISDIPTNIPERSNTYLEAIACGCNIITNNHYICSNIEYQQYLRHQMSVYEVL